MSDFPQPAPRLLQVATKNRQRIGYRRNVQLIVYLVIVPTVMMPGGRGRAHVPGRAAARLRHHHGRLRLRRGHRGRARHRLRPARGEPERAPSRLRLQGQSRATHAVHRHTSLRRDDRAIGGREDAPRVRRTSHLGVRATRRADRTSPRLGTHVEAGRKPVRFARGEGEADRRRSRGAVPVARRVGSDVVFEAECDGDVPHAGRPSCWSSMRS